MSEPPAAFDGPAPVLLVCPRPSTATHLRKCLPYLEIVVADPDALGGADMRRKWDAVVVELIGAWETQQDAWTAVVTHFPRRRILVVASDARTLVYAHRMGASSGWFTDELDKVVGELRTGGRSDDSASPWSQRPTLAPSHLESLGRLAGGVAHDFNNILTVIESCSSFSLNEVPEDTDVSRDLETIRDAGRRAAELTRRLLVFSRRGASTYDDDTHYNVVNTSVEETLLLARRVVGSDITVQLALGPEVRAVRMGMGALSQVVMNMLVNARDAMPSGGQLSVSTRVEHLQFRRQLTTDLVGPGSYCVVAVADTGIGIPAEHIGRIFTPYFTTKGPEFGTGLGLASVYGLVGECGGAIDVHSAVGEGCRMEVYLPHFQRSGGPVTGPVLLESGGTETILVVEDHEVLRAVTVRMLEQQGYTVFHAANGQEAIYVLEARAGQIQAIISDVVMPVMDGYDLASEVQRRWPYIPVMFVSAYSERAFPNQEGRIAQGAVFVAKPCSPPVVLEALRRTLSLPRQGRSDPSVVRGA